MKDANPGSNARNMMAIDFGGGLDIRVNNRFSIRALQLDSQNIKKNDDWDNDDWGAHPRISFGVIFRLTGNHQ
jgi:hypothetical protein